MQAGFAPYILHIFNKMEIQSLINVTTTLDGL